MTQKFPFMPQRDAGGSFELNNPDDKTPVREMFSLDDRLVFITDKCTYCLQVADQIDPKRENSALPHNFQQKLFDYGMESELLCRTLIQAKVLFREEFQSIDITEAKRFAFEALESLIAMNEEAKRLSADEKAAVEKVGNQGGGSRSITLPAVGNVRDRAKTYMQKADHFGLALLKIMRLFYPIAKNWDALHDIVKTQHGEQDQFFQLSESVTPILRFFRDARDALEHNPANIVIKDYELQPDGTIWLPSIAVDHRKAKHERVSLSALMNQGVASLSTAFEMLIVHACAKAAKPFAGMPMVIGVLPETYQKAWRVRFAYGAFYADGQFVPCG